MSRSYRPADPERIAQRMAQTFLSEPDPDVDGLDAVLPDPLEDLDRYLAVVATRVSVVGPASVR